MEADEVTTIIHNANGHTGHVTLTLTWSAYEDLDLEFECTNALTNYRVFWNNKYSPTCDARLDIDMRENETIKIRADGT